MHVTHVHEGLVLSSFPACPAQAVLFFSWACGGRPDVLPAVGVILHFAAHVVCFCGSLRMDMVKRVA